MIGSTIQGLEVRSKRVMRDINAADKATLVGRRIESLARRGKQIFFHLDGGVLYVHLGMTGKLLWNADPGKYARAIIRLDNGSLVFDDVRQFGRLEVYAAMPDAFAAKGPDALTIDFETFDERLRKRKGALKALLLNQSFLSGVGNIYADELLFAAKVHPRTNVARISRARSAEIHTQLIRILRKAIEMRGSSISDYVDATGLAGDFQHLHQVYGKEGEPCSVCGTPIRKIVLAQRGTHYCPRCQRA